jgi:hypothetical protein
VEAVAAVAVAAAEALDAGESRRVTP